MTRTPQSPTSSGQDELGARKALYDLIDRASIEVAINAGIASYYIEQEIKARLVSSIEIYVAHHTQEAERRAVEVYKAEQEVERWDDIHCPKGECKICDYHRPRLEAAKKHLAELSAPQQSKETSNE